MNIRPATKHDVAMAHRAVGALGAIIVLANLDERFVGEEPEKHQNVMWSREGHRIVFSAGSGTVLVSRSRDIDPAYPGKEATRG